MDVANISHTKIYHSWAYILDDIPTIYPTALIIVRGLPGSGKSYFVRNEIKNDHEFEHFEADQFFIGNQGEYKFNPEYLYKAHSLCQLQTEKALYNGDSVVVSNTFTTMKEMDFYFKLAETYKIPCITIACKSKFGSIHNVPEESMKKMEARWIDVPGELIYIPESSK